MRKRITKEELNVLNKYFNLANYLSVGQLYLWDNPLLKRELRLEDIKPKLVGHWGTVPGQNFIYTHLNRIIKNNNLDMIYISGPGHGGNSQIAEQQIRLLKGHGLVSSMDTGAVGNRNQQLAVHGSDEVQQSARIAAATTSPDRPQRDRSAPDRGPISS